MHTKPPLARASMAASPPRSHPRDDDFPRCLKRRASPFHSSDSEIDHRRRSRAFAPVANSRRRSRASPSVPNRRRGRDPEGCSMLSGYASDPSRRFRVPDREEDGDLRRRRARVDKQREDGRRLMRSRPPDDERDHPSGKHYRDSDGRRRRWSPLLDAGPCLDRCHSRQPTSDEIWRRWDDRRNRGDDRDERRRSPEKREPLSLLPYNSGRTGGNYSSSFRKLQIRLKLEDKASPEYQRVSWDALEKRINGLTNKVNVTNIKDIARELFAQNLVRGRGLFCQSCIKSQAASPGLTDVFTALVAVVNAKFPEIGRLLLVRVVLQLKRAYQGKDMAQLPSLTKFVAHLVNQAVVHELLARQLLTVLLEKPTDDSVELALEFVKECGAILQCSSPQGLHAIFERFKVICHELKLGKRVQFLIEGLFAIRKANFAGFPTISPELGLVEQGSQFTHEISLEDMLEPEINLDVFSANPNFIEDEKAYENLMRSIPGPESREDDGESDKEQMDMRDLINLRRTMYLTIISSVHFEEAGLMKIDVKPGQEMDLCLMILECCCQEKTYLHSYGLLAQRYCMMNRAYQENFKKCFVQQYSTVHCHETYKLSNVAKFFAHLFVTDTLPWHVLGCMRLTNDGLTASSRYFIKVLFQELSGHLGIGRLNERLKDLNMQGSFEVILPKDHPKNLRISNKFFTAISLGGIEESMGGDVPLLVIRQHKPASSGFKTGSKDFGSGSREF